MPGMEGPGPLPVTTASYRFCWAGGKEVMETDRSSRRPGPVWSSSLLLESVLAALVSGSYPWSDWQEDQGSAAPPSAPWLLWGEWLALGSPSSSRTLQNVPLAPHRAALPNQISQEGARLPADSTVSLLTFFEISEAVK